jgi:hypothetical protein
MGSRTSSLSSTIVLSGHRLARSSSLAGPNRDAVVRDVRLRLNPEHASVIVRVENLGIMVQPLEEVLD